MLVFYAEREDAVPVETDAKVQLDTIHKTMLKTSLPGLLLFIALGIFIMLLPFIDTDSGGYFTDVGVLRTAIGFLTIVFAVIEAMCYARWHRKAKPMTAFSPIREIRALRWP